MSGRPLAPAWLQLSLTAVFLYLAFSLIWPIGEAVAEAENPYLTLIGSVLVFMATPFLTVLIHEAGHAIVAAICAWRISMIVLGPFAVRPSPFKLTVGQSQLPLSGAVLLVPRHRDGLRRSWVAVTAGGALANVACGLLILLYVGEFEPDSAGPALAAALAKLSIAVGLLNLVPFDIGGFSSDGRLIGDAIRGRDLEPFVRCVRVVDAICHGQRPRDWPNELVEGLETDAAQPSAKGHESLLLYGRYLDKGDIDKARRALQQALNKFGARDHLKIEEAFLRAYADSEYESARSIFAGVSYRLRHMPNYLRTEALLLLGEGNAPDARRAVLKARRAFNRSPFATADDFEFLDELERRAGALGTTAPTSVVRAAEGLASS